MLAEIDELDAGGRSSATRAAVVPDTSTWPPWPIASRRAARLSAGPKKSPSRTSALPEWIAIRTSTGRSAATRARPAPAGRRSRPMSAAPASSKDASIPSPVVLTIVPPAWSRAARSSESWASSATAIASRCSSQSRELPSMSVKRNVNVRADVPTRVGPVSCIPHQPPEDAASLGRSARAHHVRPPVFVERPPTTHTNFPWCRAPPRSTADTLRAR